MKKTTSFMILSQQDRLSLKCPIKMRTSLILLAGTMFHLAIPAFAYSADALLPSPNASIKSVAPESVQINGSIKDSKGEALIGVNVKIKNSSNGTITDFNGEFSIKASNGDILEISYVGYKPTRVRDKFCSKERELV